MARLGLERTVINAEVLNRTAGRFRQAGVVLPTIAPLTNPSTILLTVHDKLRAVDPDAPDSLNLFRVHWFNAASKGFTDVPQGVSLEEFKMRSEQSYWDRLMEFVPAWDAMISEVNACSAATPALGQ